MSQATRYLKIAGEQDLPAFLMLTEELFANTIYSQFTKFDEKYVTSAFKDSLEAGQEEACTVLLFQDEVPVGVITMSKMALMGDNSIATELVFWIKPEARDQGSLLMLTRAYRYWAKLVGCKAMYLGKIKNKNVPEEYTIRRL